MTNCIVEQSGQTVKKYLSLTSYDLIQKDERMFDIYKKATIVSDRINASKIKYIKARDSFQTFWKTLDETKRVGFVNNFRATIRSAQKANDPNTLLYEVMFNSKLFDTDIVTTVKLLEEVMGKDLDKYKILGMINSKDGLLDIFDNLPNSMKYPILSVPGMTYSNLKENIGKILNQNGITGKREEHMITDFMGGPLGVGALRKLSGTLRQFYSMLKFGPITGLLGGSLLLMNNIVLGVLNLMGRRRGLEGLLEHKGLDLLIEGSHDFDGILKDSSREMSLSRENLSVNGKNMFFNFTTKLLDKIPFIGPVWKQRLESITLSGIHTIRDMGAQKTVVKTAIVQALSKNGIQGRNMDLFFKKLEEGLIKTDFLDRIRADAHMYYTQYYTAGNILALNRHSFSRRWMFTNLQNYVIVRSDEMYRGIKNCYDVRKSGDLRTRGDFVDYINTDNQELKSLLNNVLLSAKASIYINHVVNQHESEDAKSTFKYMAGISEYISSMDSTFFMRILESPFSGVSKYMRYTAATGKEESFVEGVNVAFMNTLAETMAMLFREGKVLDIFVDAASSFVKTGDIDFAASVAGTDLEKIANGMGRFMLLPGEDVYGQKALEQSDDMVNRILLSYGWSNEGVKQAGKIRGIGDAEQILKDTSGFMIRAFQYLPIRGKVMEMGKEKVGWNEAKYNMFSDMVENDPGLKEIWDGNIPEGLLEASPTIAEGLYKDLAEFQYYAKRYSGDGKHEMGTYGLTKMEEDVFIDNIATKVFGSAEAMDKALVGQTANNKEIIKVMAAAEAGEPGSSRIVLSYLSNKMLQNLKQTYLGDKYAKSADIPTEVEDEFHRMIVKQYYPYVYAADKTAWYKLASKYVEYAQPDIFKGLSADTKLQGFVNSLGFLDLMVKQAGDNGNVSASYIKNSFNFGTKYITDPDDRLKLVKHSMATIDGLGSADVSQKNLMRLGVMGANIDFYNELKKDPIAKILYKKDMQEFESMVRGNIDDINMKGIKGIEGDMSSDYAAKRQYYGAYGSSYSQGSNSAGNKKFVDNLLDKYDRALQPMEYGRPSYVNNRPISYPASSDIGNLAPKRYGIYAKFYNEQLAAYSKGIVNTTMREYPSQTLEGLKFTTKNYNRKFIPDVKPIRFKRPNKKYASYKTRSDLPGSTNDVGAD